MSWASIRGTAIPQTSAPRLALRSEALRFPEPNTDQNPTVHLAVCPLHGGIFFLLDGFFEGMNWMISTYFFDCIRFPNSYIFPNQ